MSLRLLMLVDFDYVVRGTACNKLLIIGLYTKLEYGESQNYGYYWLIRGGWGGTITGWAGV